MTAKLEFSITRWDDSDFVVCVKPNWEKPWKSVPIGRVEGNSNAKIIADWLPTAIGEIEQIIKNGYEKPTDNRKK